MRAFRVLLPLLLLFGLGAWVLFGKRQEPPASSNPAGSRMDESTLTTANLSLQLKAPVSALNREDQAKIKTLESVLAARNDNDPRLDQELKQLSEPLKRAFEEKYFSLSAEKRNELGTIVFLLGRNLRTEQDLEFMERVVLSSPCRSLENCDSDPPNADPSLLHAEAGMELTLAYPQVVALKSLEKMLLAGSNDPLYAKAREILASAAHSKIAKVAQVAQSIIQESSN